MPSKAGVQPKSGDLLLITERASVQFVACEPFLFAVIGQHDWSTYQGWVWLDGYQLDASGIARDRRSIFVQFSGLIYVNQASTRSRTRHRAVTTHYPNTRPSVGRTRLRAFTDVEPDRP